MQEEPSDDILTETALGLVLSGDRQAIHDFCLKVCPLFRTVVQRSLHRYGVPVDDRVQDFIHDILGDLLDNKMHALRGWDPKRGRLLRNYLCVFARMRIVDRLRQGRMGRAVEALMSVEDVVLWAGADPRALERTRCRDLFIDLYRQFLISSTEEDQQLFELSFIEEIPSEELSKRLGITVPALFTRRKRLRERLLELRDKILAEGEGQVRRLHS